MGYRLGKFLESKGIIGLLVKYLHDERFQSDDELKENTFQTFESLVLRCPSEVRPFIDEILAQALEFIKWDPNYDAVSDEEEEEEDGEDDEEEEEPSDDEDYSDDDDMSWKVRRAAAKCIDAVVVTRPDLLEKLYKMVVPAIVARFKEREENVKLDIFGVFIDVLKQTTLVSRGSRNTEEGVLAQLKSNVRAPISRSHGLLLGFEPCLAWFDLFFLVTVADPRGDGQPEQGAQVQGGQGQVQDRHLPAAEGARPHLPRRPQRAHRRRRRGHHHLPHRTDCTPAATVAQHRSAAFFLD